MSMALALALGLNAALLALALPWLRRQWQWAGRVGWHPVFVAGLALRVAVGLKKALPLQLDAAFISNLAGQVTRQLWAHPGGAARLLTQAVTIVPDGGGGEMVYQNSSNTWMLIKLLALLNLASGGLGWLNALYLSVFAFAGCWRLARSLAVHFPDTPAGAGAVALLFWPSVWFWAAGVSKEAVLLGAGAWLTARVLDGLYRPAAAARPGAGWWLGTLALAGLHFAMRYFFALPLLVALAGLALGRALGRGRPRRWAAGLGLALVLGAGAWLAPALSVAFRWNKFVSQVVRVYEGTRAGSVGRPHFEYPDLRPTGASIAAHAPQAVANTLTQPWLGQSRQPPYLAAGLENLALLLLLGTAAVAGLRGRGGRLPFALVLAFGFLSLLLAFLIGISTPNLGSLHRYRVALLPYLLLLLLQNDYAAALLRGLRLRARAAAATGAGHPANA